MNITKAALRKSKKSLFQSFVVLFLLLVMITPVYANSFAWSYTSNAGGMIINGKANGKTYQMTAGQMILDGGVTIVMDTGSPYATWKHTVRKVGTLWDTSICNVSVTPNIPAARFGFTKDCGQQSAGTNYLYIERITGSGHSDERIVIGDGTLTTN